MRNNEKRKERLEKRNQKIAEAFRALISVQERGVRKYTYAHCIGTVAEKYCLSELTIERIINDIKKRDE